MLTGLAQRRLRSKIPELVETLNGRFTKHHAFLVSEYLTQLDQHQATIDRLTERIEALIHPFRFARDILVTSRGYPSLSPMSSSPKPVLT